MSLDLLNYLENARLRTAVERNAEHLEFIFKHPVRFLLIQFGWPIRGLIKCIKNFRQAQKIKHLIISNQPSGIVLGETFFNLVTLDSQRNQYAVEMPVYLGDTTPGYSGTGEASRLKLTSGNKKFVIVHAFYLEEAKIIFEKLQAFEDYDIFLTTPIAEIRDHFGELFEPSRSACFFVQNQGRDVLPFLLLLKLLDYSKYTHFVKIHTKRSQHLNDRGRWFRQNIDVLVGNKLITDRIFQCISADKSSIYGVELLPMQDHLANNRNWLEYLFEQTPDEITASFIPGTMFVGTAQFLRKLEQENLHLHKLEDELGQLDGCLVHAVERYLGYLTKASGGECNTLEKLALKGERI